MIFRIFTFLTLVPVLASILSCQKSPESNLPELMLLDSLNPPAYTLGGPLDGLFGSQTVAENSITPSQLSFKEARTDKLDLSAGTGSYEFAESLYTGESYAVKITAHPRSPTQLCTPANEGTGNIENESVSDLTISCEGAYRIYTSVSGLAGSGLQMDSSAGDLLEIASDGNVEFPTPFKLSDGYQATISNQPTSPWQTCTFPGGSSSVSGSNLSENDMTIESVSCVTNKYPITANLSGLVNDGLYVLLNSTSVEIPGGTTSIELGQVESGQSFSVSVSSNPVGQECSVFGSTGDITSAGATVELSCTQNGYMVGGSLSGYSGSGLTLVATGSHPETRTVDQGKTGYYFLTTYNHSDTYSLSISAQPTNPWQTCSITQKATGTISETTGSVTDANISCTTNQYKISGTISGLTYDGLVLGIGGNSYTISAGSTSFNTGSWDSGTSYTLSVLSNPSYQSCTVTNGSGSVANGDITNISVSCSYLSYAVQATIGGLVNTDQVTVIDGTHGTVYAGIGSNVTLYNLEHLSTYSLAVSANGYSCTISNPTGTVFGANVTNIGINCTPNTYTVSGSITGLLGSDQTVVSSGTGVNSAFIGNTLSQTFFNLTHGSNYAISASPAGYSCSVTGGTNGNGTGTINAAALTGVSITCTPLAYNYTGTVSGLTIGTDQVDLTLTINGTPTNYPIVGNGSGGTYSLTHGDTYSLSATATGYSSCTVTGGGDGSGGGVVAGASPPAFSVTCTPMTYNIDFYLATYDTGNTPGSLTVGDTGTTGFTYTIGANKNPAVTIGSLTRGQDYSIAITNPSYQTCTNSTLPTAGGPQITGNYTINLTCNNTHFPLNLSVNGLAATESITLLNQGANAQTISYSNGTTDTGTFGYINGSYAVSISSQPAGKVCSIKELQFGTITAATTLYVNCVTGAMVDGGFHVVPGAPLNIPLYRSKVKLTGSQSLATLSYSGLVYNSDNSHLYVLTRGSGAAIYMMNSVDLSVTGTISGFTGNLQGAVTDGTNLYVTEWAAGTLGKIWKINLPSGSPVLLAGGNSTGSTDGSALSATFEAPYGLALDGNNLLITEATGKRIRRLDLSRGTVSTIYSSAPAGVTDIVIVGSSVYFTMGEGVYTATYDSLTGTIGTPTLYSGNLSTPGYLDGSRLTARYTTPHDLISDGTDLYLTELGGNRIRRINTKTNTVTTIAGGGTSISAGGTGASLGFGSPMGIATDGRRLYVTDVDGSNQRITTLSDEGLVGSWPLNGSLDDYNSDNSTTNLLTYAGGNTPYRIGRYSESSGAMEVRGIDRTNANLPLTDLSDSSLSFWFQLDNVATVQSLVHIGTWGVDGLGVYYDPALPSGLALQVNGSTTIPIPLNVLTGKWYHATVVVNGGTATIFINGHPIASGAAASVVPTTVMTMGCARNGSSASVNFMTGALADVRVYNRILNDGEINELARMATSSQVEASYNNGPIGLLSHYPLNDGQKTNIGPLPNLGTSDGTIDTTLRGHDSLTNGAIRFASGYLRASPTIGFPSGAQPRTLCAWVKPDAYPAGDGVIAAYGDPAKGSSQVFGLAMKATGHVYVWDASSSPVPSVSGYRLPLQTWTQVCATNNGAAGTSILYFDGQVVASDTGRVLSTPTGGANYLNIGGWETAPGVPMNYFNGIVDDVRVYNNALSDYHVRLLSARLPVGLMARYDMLENPVDGKTRDVSGWSNNAAITNGSTFRNDTFNRQSAAYEFTRSSSQYLQANHQSHLKNSNGISLSAWIKPRTLPGSGEIYTIISKNSGIDGYSLELFNSSGTQTLYWYKDGSQATYAKVIVPQGVYSHVAVSQIGSTVALYLNGAKLSNDSSSITALPTETNGDLLVGGRYDGNYFDGIVDNVQIWNRVIDQQEVLALSGYHPSQTTVWNQNASTSKLKMHLNAESLDLNDGATAGISLSDISGNGINMDDNTISCTTGGSMIYYAKIANDRPAIDFNNGMCLGSNSVAASLSALDTSNLAIYLVTSPDTVSGVNYLFDTPNKFSIFINGPFWAGRYYNQSGSYEILSGLSSANPGEWDLLGYEFDGAAKSHSILENGAVENTINTGNAMKTSISPIPYLGGGNSTGYDGKISELLLFDSTLGTTNTYYTSVTDRNVVQCYLSARYGIKLTYLCPW